MLDRLSTGARPDTECRGRELNKRLVDSRKGSGLKA